MGKVKEVLIFGMVVIFLVSGWYALFNHDKTQDQNTSSTTLGPDIQEKIIFNPKTHSFTSVTSQGDKTNVRTSYLSNSTAIEVAKNGKVTVIQRTFGTEVSPWIGFSYSDTARLGIGADLLFYHNLNLGIGIFPTVSGSFSIRIGPVVSYNVWSNTSLFIGVTNQLAPIGGLSLRF